MSDRVVRYAESILAYKSIKRQRAWEFEVVLDDFPDFLFYCKDIEYPLFDLATEENQFGGMFFSVFVGRNIRLIEMTLGESEKGQLKAYFNKWAQQCVHLNGTFGHPDEYLRKFTLFPFTNEGKRQKEQKEELLLAPVKADTSWGYDKSENQEIRVTLTQYQSQ